MFPFAKPFNILLVLGEGQFGKVYTAVNNDTGDLMAMKEVNIFISVRFGVTFNRYGHVKFNL